MVIKRFRMPLVWLIVALLLSMVSPVMATATETALPDGFTGMDAVNLEVDSGYAWHKMTDTEAAAYGLSDYADSNVYIAGNCGREDGVDLEKAVSNMSISVTKPGSLSFEYALSAANHSNSYIGYSVNAQIAVGTNRSNCEWYATGTVVPGTDGWATCTISIDETAFVDSAPAVIYIAYHHRTYYADKEYDDLNYAAIRNVVYSTGGRENVVQDYDTNMGTVTVQQVGDTLTDADLDDLDIGSTYRLSAIANDGYQFYGWVKCNGSTAEYQTVENGALDVIVDQSTYYTPIFAATGNYVLRNGTTFYDGTTSLKAAIEGAVSGDVLVLLKSSTVTEDITVPAGVTLYVPFRAEWEHEEADGEYHPDKDSNVIRSIAIAGEDKTYVRLTVNSGRTLSVNGDAVIGSVLGYKNQRAQNHVSGAHGRITNNGDIVINDGGTLTCYGIVDGSGTVYVNDGGDVKESFIIGDYSGGSNTSELFEAGQMPFKRFAMQSIQCMLKMEARANLIAMMNLWATKTFNEAEIVLMGSDSSAAFLTESSLADTLVLTRTYDGSKALTDGSGVLDVTGIGRTEWTFTGGLTFQPFKISVSGLTLDTSSCDFVVPYNFKLNLIQGIYSIPLGLRLLPGAELNIASGATVNVGGRLMAMDGLVQSDILNDSGDLYPTRKILETAGFSGSGELIVDGTLVIADKATLGGLIKSNGTGTIEIASGAYVSNTGTLSQLDQTKELIAQDGSWYPSDGGVAEFSSGKVVKIHDWVQQDGAVGYYDENTTWFNLPARIYTAEGVAKVEAGKTYIASAQSGTAAYTAEYLYVADGVYGKISDGKYSYLTSSGVREMTPATESISRSVNAVWVDSEASEEEIPIAEPVVAGKDDVTVAYDEPVRSGNYILLSGLKAVDEETGAGKDEKYVFLVKYTTEGSTTATTAKFENGVYSVSSVADSVTIEACLLGDLYGSGTITTTDFTALRRFLAGTYTPKEVCQLAGDTNGSNSMSTTDITALRRYLAGTYSFK